MKTELEQLKNDLSSKEPDQSDFERFNICQVFRNENYPMWLVVWFNFIAYIALWFFFGTDFWDTINYRDEDDFEHYSWYFHLNWLIQFSITLVIYLFLNIIVLGTDNMDIKSSIIVSYAIPATNIIIGVCRTVSNTKYRVDFDKVESEAGRLNFDRLYIEHKKYYQWDNMKREWWFLLFVIGTLLHSWLTFVYFQMEANEYITGKSKMGENTGEPEVENISDEHGVDETV